MRIGRANDHGMGLPFHAEIIAEATPAGEQTKVFLAKQGLSDRTHLTWLLLGARRGCYSSHRYLGLVEGLAHASWGTPGSLRTPFSSRLYQWQYEAPQTDALREIAHDNSHRRDRGKPLACAQRCRLPAPPYLNAGRETGRNPRFRRQSRRKTSRRGR